MDDGERGHSPRGLSLTLQDINVLAVQSLIHTAQQQGILLLSCLQHSILVRIVHQFAEKAIDFNDDIFESFEMLLTAKTTGDQNC